MKFRERNQEPIAYETRIITKFLFFPKTLVRNSTGYFQTRWLETASIIQEFFGYWDDMEWND